MHHECYILFGGCFLGNSVFFFLWHKKANVLTGTILCNYAIGDLKYHNKIYTPMKYVTKTRENI